MEHKGQLCVRMQFLCWRWVKMTICFEWSLKFVLLWINCGFCDSHFRFFCSNKDDDFRVYGCKSGTFLLLWISIISSSEGFIVGRFWKLLSRLYFHPVRKLDLAKKNKSLSFNTVFIVSILAARNNSVFMCTFSFSVSAKVVCCNFYGGNVWDQMACWELSKKPSSVQMSGRCPEITFCYFHAFL